LEEASVRLGQGLRIGVANVTNSVVVTEVIHIGRQTLASPDILEVLLLLKLFHGFHNIPEFLNDLMVFITAEILGDLLDGLEVHNFVSSSSDLDFFPSEHVKNVSRNNGVDSLLDPVELFLSFLKTLLHQKISVFLDVFFGDHLVSASFTNFNFLLVAENSGESLLNSSFEISVTELLGIFAQLLNCLPSVSVEALKVIEL
jgi:hypothetical protein